MDAIYARQSIDKKDSLSIETQLSFAKGMAIGEPEVYIDRGISGKDVVHRPEFLRLLNDIKVPLTESLFISLIVLRALFWTLQIPGNT